MTINLLSASQILYNMVNMQATTSVDNNSGGDHEVITERRDAIDDVLNLQLPQKETDPVEETKVLNPSVSMTIFGGWGHPYQKASSRHHSQNSMEGTIHKSISLP